MQFAVLSRERGAILAESNLVMVRLDACWLKTGRPHPITLDVSQIDVRSPVVADAILSPTCYRQIPPTAVTRTRRCQHDAISTIR